MPVNDKFKKILRIIGLGASIFIIESLIQLILVLAFNSYALDNFLNEISNNSFNFKLISHYFIDVENIIYFRLSLYLLIWVIVFIYGFKILKIKNSLIRLICFNLILMLFTSLFVFPLSLFLFFTPPFYNLLVSIIISPIIIYKIPYFRILLDDYSDKQ